MMINKELLHVSDVASLLACSSHLVYQYIKEGKIKAYKPDGCRAWRIPAKSVDDFVANMIDGQS